MCLFLLLLLLPSSNLDMILCRGDSKTAICLLICLNEEFIIQHIWFSKSLFCIFCAIGIKDTKQQSKCMICVIAITSAVSTLEKRTDTKIICRKINICKKSSEKMCFCLGYYDSLLLNALSVDKCDMPHYMASVLNICVICVMCNW